MSNITISIPADEIREMIVKYLSEKGLHVEMEGVRFNVRIESKGNHRDGFTPRGVFTSASAKVSKIEIANSDRMSDKR